jgi:predicted nucleic acid-binding protein
VTKVLVDTDVLIEHLRARPPVADKFRELFTKGFSVFHSPVSRSEIYAGMRKGEEQPTANLFRVMGLVVIDDRVGEKAGEYMRQYRASHSVELADALQAACAFVFHLPLWALNRKHYPMRDIQFFEI